MVVRCRGIVLHDGRLLLVRHPHDVSHAALPGGHLDWGENVLKCMSREMVEELGVAPDIGRLLYVNTFIDSKNETQSTEFFFEIKNGEAYLDTQNKKELTHMNLQKHFGLAKRMI